MTAVKRITSLFLTRYDVNENALEYSRSSNIGIKVVMKMQQLQFRFSKGEGTSQLQAYWPRPLYVKRGRVSLQEYGFSIRPYEDSHISRLKMKIKNPAIKLLVLDHSAWTYKILV